MRKDQGFIENLFSVGPKLDSKRTPQSPLWKWKEKHKKKKVVAKLSTENMVFIGIVVALIVLLSWLEAFGAIGGALSSAWTSLCSGIGWLSGGGGKHIRWIQACRISRYSCNRNREKQVFKRQQKQ